MLAAFGGVTVSGDRDTENSRTVSSNTTPGQGSRRVRGSPQGEMVLLIPFPTDRRGSHFRQGSGAQTGIVIFPSYVSMSGATSELKGSSPSPWPVLLLKQVFSTLPLTFGSEHSFTIFFFFFLLCGHTSCYVGSQLPDQGLNPHPLHWEHSVLATGPPGKSLG